MIESQHEKLQTNKQRMHLTAMTVINRNEGTMKAAQGKDYGPIDEMISVESNVPMPDISTWSRKDRKKKMIIKTHAVALACGDCRTLSGLTREFQGPPSFPYIPCGDCSGVVTEIPQEANGSCPFQVGDRVAARFADGPRDALAEYAVVSWSVCTKIPDDIKSEHAAALVGAAPALLAAERMKAGDRVLILGAGGGVGSHVCQIMRSRGVSFIAGLSQTPERLLEAPLTYDRAFDYTKEDIFDRQEFKDRPFDVIFDLAGGGWPRLMKDYNTGVKSIIKPASSGGLFLTVTPDSAIFEMHSVKDILLLFLCVPLGRAFKSRAWGRRGLPKFTQPFLLPDDSEHLTRLLEMAEKKCVQAVLHDDQTFEFSTDGVRKAFKVQESRHGHGKVVVKLSD